MSEHLRRGALLRLAIAALTLAIPAAWAAGRILAIGRRIRYGRPGKHGPGLPDDGEPLEPWERDVFLGITRAEGSRR